MKRNVSNRLLEGVGIESREKLDGYTLFVIKDETGAAIDIFIENDLRGGPISVIRNPKTKRATIKRDSGKFDTDTHVEYFMDQLEKARAAILEAARRYPTLVRWN